MSARWWCAICATSAPSEASLREHYVDEHPTATPGLRIQAQLQQTQAALAASQADLTAARNELAETFAAAERNVERLTFARGELARVERELHDALRRASDLEQVREELRQTKVLYDGELEDNQDLRSDVTSLRLALGDSQHDLTRVERERDEARGALTGARRRVNEVIEAEDLAMEQAARFRHRLDLTSAELVSARQELEQEAARHRVLWNIERDACVKLRQRLETMRIQLAATVEFASAQHVHCPDSPAAPAPGPEEGEPST